jgi:hypothetical protein
MGDHLKGLAEGAWAGREINLILKLILFSTNRLPAAKNSGRNGIHH